MAENANHPKTGNDDVNAQLLKMLQEQEEERKKKKKLTKFLGYVGLGVLLVSAAIIGVTIAAILPYFL